MKFILLSILSLSAFHLCSAQKITSQHRQLFVHKTLDGSSNYIEFIPSQKTLKGIFCGVEVNTDGTPVFFRSSFNYSKKKNKDGKGFSIDFILEKYEYSHKPFDGEAANNDTISDPNKIPFNLQHRMMFFGTMNPNRLELGRTTDFYDSRVDPMTFKRVNK